MPNPNRMRRRLGLTPTFNPRSIAGLLAWFKADSLSLTDSAAVATWPDQSGNGNDATQATGANQPLYKVGILNGKPVVRFDGVNDVLNTVALTWPQTFTMFGVAQSSGGAYPQNFLDADNNGSPAPRMMQFRFNTATAGMIVAFNTVPSPFTDTSPAITAAAYTVFSAVRDSTTCECFANGATNGSTATTGTPNSGSKILSVGAGVTLGTTAPLQGDIAEGLVYSGVLSTSDRRRVEAYLGRKYGIAVS